MGGGGEGFKSLNRVDIYDPVADVWVSGRPMPTHRSGVVAAALGDKIYVMGGGYKNKDGTFTFLKAVEIYDPAGDAWSTGRDLQTRHDAPAATGFGPDLYLFGGHHPEARGGPLTDPATDCCEAFDSKEGTWVCVAPMPTPRFSLAAVPWGERILAMGGGAFREGVFRNFDLIEAYVPATGTWLKKSGMLLPWPSAGLGGCLLGGVLYVLGGNDGTGIQRRVACLGPAGDEWIECPGMIEPRAAMGVATLDGTLYALGGRGADVRTPVGTVEAFRPSSA